MKELFRNSPVLTFITIIAIAWGAVMTTYIVAPAAGPVVNAPTAPSEQGELGVIVTNETNTNIVVFSAAGTQGCAVPPGGFCFAQCPPGWSYLTIKVVRCGKDGDMEDPDNPVTFRMDEVRVHRVEPREF